MEGHLDHMGFEGSLVRRIADCFRRIAAHHRLAEVARTDQVPGRWQAGIQWVEAEDHPSAAASCVAVRIVLAGLGPEGCPGRFWPLLGAGAPLRPCAGYLPPSSWPSILCEFL